MGFLNDRFLNLLSRIRNKESSYNHVGYLVSANLVTVLSQFIFAPVLTRIYSPDSYGIFATFFAAGLNISALLTMRYEQSLLLETEKENRKLISAILVTIAFVFCSILFVLMLVNVEFASNLIGANSTTYWVLLFPLFIFSNIFFLVTGVEATLAKKFRDAFVWGSPSLIASKFVNLGYGYFFSGHFSGLVFGDIFLRIAFLIFRIAVSLKNRFWSYFIFSKIKIRKAISLLKKYKKFPFYELPSSYFSLFVGQSHLYLLAAIKETTILGWLGISFSLLDAPLRLISYSISPILMQRATEMRNRLPEFRIILERVVSVIFFIALIPSAILYFWGEDIFAFMFGKEWAMSGVIVSSFIFFYMFRFEFDILDNIMTVMGLQKKKFVIYLIEGFTRVSLLMITWFITKDAFKTIILWAYECAIVYFFVTLFSYRLLNLRLKKLIMFKIIISVIFFIAFIWKYY